MAQFLNDAGTNGLIQAQFNVLTTELNTLGSGSVSAASAAFTQTNFSSAAWGSFQFKSGGAFTPTAGGFLAGWFLISQDGGSTYETVIATASTTVPPIGRVPDFIIPTYEGGAAWASGNIRANQGRYIKTPWEPFKVILWNNSGVALPASGNVLSATGLAIKVI